MPRSPLTHPCTMRVALVIAEAGSRRMRSHLRGPAVHPVSLRGSSDEGRQHEQSRCRLPVDRAKMCAVERQRAQTTDATNARRNNFSQRTCVWLRYGHSRVASGLLTAGRPHAPDHRGTTASGTLFPHEAAGRATSRLEQLSKLYPAHSTQRSSATSIQPTIRPASTSLSKFPKTRMPILCVQDHPPSTLNHLLR